MAIFDMMSPPVEHMRPQAYDINNKYFTVDTAENEVVTDWVNYNRRIVTYAVRGEVVEGFFNVMPLTTECGELFMRNEMLEEDLRIEHMLPHEALPYAKYAYVSGIAVRETEPYVYKQCAAALLSVMANVLLDGYSKENFKYLFANPTTFNGNKLVRRLGLKPLQSYKKSLKGNDLYVAEMNEETRAVLQELADRYACFVGYNPWKEDKENGRI